MARVTGIGGIFLRARDPKTLAAWYAQHLGIQLSEYGGATLLWTDEIPATTGMTTWSLFPENTKYFGPGNEKGPQQAMVNYRVDDLDALLTQLAAAGVSIDRNALPNASLKLRPSAIASPTDFIVVVSSGSAGSSLPPVSVRS